ncbi:MAG: chromosome partitioning protein [Microbacteriaceae bacterium]|nr:chromosome partitioning protein [Microbacteriaceae bacterium]
MTHTPHIEATVVRSAEGPFIGHISVDGSITTIEGRTEDGVRRDIVRAVAGVAQRLSQPVRLVARDSLGVQEVKVSPDGYTEALTPVTPATGNTIDAPTPAEPAPTEALDFDAILGIGGAHNPGQVPAEDDATATQPARRAAAVPELDYLFQETPAQQPDVAPAAPAAAPVVAPQPAVRPVVTLPVAQPVTAAPVAPVTPIVPVQPIAAVPAPPVQSAPAAPESPVAATGNGGLEPLEFVDPLAPVDEHPPTLDDFMAQRPTAPIAPAEYGWQGAVRKASFGLVNPVPGDAELERRRDVAAVQRSFAGPRTIVVINPKGGAHKTTATMLLAATFGEQRGGYTLAWDNNETRGTLGWRARPADHHRTALSLLRDADRFSAAGTASIGDLDEYVRAQGSAQFDVLASDEDPNATELIDAAAFDKLHATLQRFYRLIVVDTGNNMRAENWQAAVAAADQLVIISTVREDTAASAAWLVDGLREKGFGDKVANAVTVLSATSEAPDPQLARRLRGHFGSLTRAVLDVPHDPSLVDGGAITFELLSRRTREAWLKVAATVAQGL